MDDELYWNCDVEKCEYWDLDVEFATSTEIAESRTEVCDECGFGSVYSAIWQDGQIRGWDINDQNWIRVGIQSVALKTINNPIDPISDILKEIESNIEVVDDPHFIRCLGITQDSKTNNYMIVMEYATSGSLRAYMNANNMDADEKGRILWSISKGLYNLHEKNLIHQDFHPGNLLLINGFLSISDFGLCKQENQKSTTEKIFGVLPYVAPEVLCGEEYTKASDVYSFSIVAWELITGYPPYHNIPHDSGLALQICRGKRPKIPSNVPKIMARLIEECWDADPKKRPTSKQLFTIINKWLMSSAFDKFILPTSILPSYKLHSKAIYTSRAFNSTGSKPSNASTFRTMYSKGNNLFNIIIYLIQYNTNL
ncbi:14006_t:CDS:2 [Racocetra fulgida]|uniref:14006_t:CDS:1 n=1 Tax=Racocetra fulgida TaxID=60492 RepID=A0A9N8VK05_9GLOM|nr:14006_t:CDS:2 [Racocetra fulgida]